jgi:beta-glucosidase
LLVSAQAPSVDNAIERAVTAAEAADVAILVVGTNADWESEGEDRETLALPGEQDDLIRRVAAVNPHTIVVLNAGSPVAMPWLAEVAAVLQIWFPGEEFGEALADVLFGIAEPSGRLPITIPRRLEDTPAFAHHPGRDGSAVYGEGLLIGHRWYDEQSIEPEFPFGYGLGYTQWAMGEATATGEIARGVLVQVPVRNVGQRAGSTVVQCYVEPVTREFGRPLRTLQGFAKVHARAGGEALAEISLNSRAFSHWDVAARRWVVAAGDYRILVGWSSADLTHLSVSRAPAAG